MKSNSIALLLLAATAMTACDRTTPPPPTATDQAPTPAPTTEPEPAPTTSGATDGATAAQAESAAAAGRATCAGLRGVQKMTIHATDGTGHFRFSDEADALVYETQWEGDLNGDGALDRVARRVGKTARSIRMVLVGCGDQFALVWVGASTSIAVKETSADVGAQPWADLEIATKGSTHRYRFNGEKYQPLP